MTNHYVPGAYARYMGAKSLLKLLHELKIHIWDPMESWSVLTNLRDGAKPDA